MPRLKNVRSLSTAGPADLRRLSRDERIISTADAQWAVVNADGSHRAVLDWDPSIGSLRLYVGEGPDNSALQRINRLLDGSGFRLRTYHRADNALRMHGAGKYNPLPGVASMSPAGTWTYEADSEPPVTAPTPVPASPFCSYCSDPFTEPSIGHKCNPIARADDEAPVTPESTREALESVADVESVAPVPESKPEAVTTDLLQRPTVTKRSEVKVPADIQTGLDRLWQMHVDGNRQVVALIGPTGTGKTSLVYNLAARNKVGVFNFDCAGAREFSDFVGVTHLKGDETVFVPSALLQVIDADGPYAGQPRIVNLDEITRAESSGALNALIPMLHGFASIYVPEAGRTFNVDPAVMFTATANRGSQYSGTVGMDLALANRVTAWVKMNYADAATEVDIIVARSGVEPDKASALVNAADRIRQMAGRGELPEGGGISTRLLIEAAHKVAAGFSTHEAASWTWVGNYPDEGGSSSESYAVQSAIDYSLR